MTRKLRFFLIPMIISILIFSGCSSKSGQFTEEGLQLYEEERYEEAVLAFEAAIAEDNKSARPLVYLGMTHLELNDTEKAQEYFEQALEIDAEEQMAYRGMGIVCMNKGEYENAIIYFDTALIKDTSTTGQIEADIYLYKAEAQLSAGNYNGAINTYTELLEKDKKNISYLYLRGRAYLTAANLEAALADFDEGIAQSPEEYSYYVNIYETLDNAGELEHAKKYLQAALEIEDGETPAHQYRGKIQYLLENYQEAVAEFEAVTEDMDVDTCMYMGMSYDQLGDTDKAYEAYAKALAADPENAGLYNQLGLYKMQLGDYEVALTYFQNGQQLKDVEMVKLLMKNEGICYEKMYQYADALAVFEKYIQTFGEDEEIRHEIEFLRTR